MQKDFFTPGQQASQSESSGGESRSVRTFTVTEGVGPNKVQGLKTIPKKVMRLGHKGKRNRKRGSGLWATMQT